jgi:hypothetical protein
MVLQAGQPATEVMGWRLVPTSGRAVSKDSREIQSTAPGLRDLLRFAPVFPESGTGFDENTEDARLFGWMSRADSLWYDASDWSTPLTFGATRWNVARSSQFITADTSAAIGDVHLFRRQFTLPNPRTLRIFWSADDTGSLYVDSKLLQTAERGGVIHSVDVTLSGGQHTIAAEVRNTRMDILKFACAITYVSSTTDKPTTLFAQSDTTHWKCHKVVGSKPGWSAGAIFRKILAEAQAASVYGSAFLSPDFTGAVDSNGVTWPELHEKAFPITTPLSDVVRELEELGFSLRIMPDGTVKAYVTQGSDVSSTVWFQRGVNLLDLTWQGIEASATRMLVRSQQGWSTSSDSGAIADASRGGAVRVDHVRHVQLARAGAAAR